MFTIKNSLISFLLLSAVSLSMWSFLNTHHKTATITASAEELPDAYMENIVAIIMNKMGTPKLKIETPKMEHFSKQDRTVVITPHVTIYRQSPEPWIIDSELAETFDGTNQINFKNNVKISHQPDSANPQTQIQTTTLTLFPNQQIAQTEEPITLIQPDTKIYAVGMLSNLKDGTIKLLSKARGEYAPTS